MSEYETRVTDEGRGEIKADLEISLDTRGNGKILVGGKDISHRIYKVEISAAAGEIFHAVMYMRVGTVKVHGSAWVGMETLIVDGPGELSKRRNGASYEAVSNEEAHL